VAALTSHARHRVVVEVTAEHPQATLNRLWEHFHGVVRPTRPTAVDAAAVARDLGFAVEIERFEAPPRWTDADWDELVVFARRRLCLPPERDAEVAAVLERPGPRPLVTLWWPGSASGEAGKAP
jgi:hypothetical protein